MISVLLGAVKAGEVLDPYRHTSWWIAANVVVWGGILLYAGGLLAWFAHLKSKS